MTTHFAPTPLRAVALAVLMSAGPTWAQAPAGRPAAVRADTQVTLNFVNAEIDAVTRAMAAMQGKTIVVDPRVKGQITLYSDQPLRPAEAYAQYLSALRGLGFAVIDAAGLLKVVPEAEAKVQATGVLLDGQRTKGDLILTQVFSLKHENANNLVAVLRPLVNVNNTINANPGNNSLVITDYADNLSRIAKIIAALDTPAATDIEIVPLKHTVASDLAALVQKLGDGAAAAPGAAAGAGGSSVLADPRGNALILRAANPARLLALKALVLKLDQPSADASSPIRVVHLKNADATKLAQVLRAAFSQSGGSNAAGSGNSSPMSPMPNNVPAVSTNPQNGMGNVAGLSSSAPVAASANPSTGGFVQADPATNSLIITAPEPLYRQMRVVIDQLDGRRAQVFVEAMIVKLDTSKSAQFGVQWQNLFGSKGDSTITGAGTNFGSGSGNIITATGAIASGLDGVTKALANSSAPGGLNLGVLKKFGQYYTLGALANFLEQEGGGNILSMPTLVALDNEEAQILVGQNVPFLTGSYAQSAGSGNSVNPFQTVERKDVGLILKVKSQIGEGGTVRMVVTQELSSIGSQSAQGPITNKTSVQTTVSVDNNDLLVLGGLMQDEFSDGTSGVPGLSRIPLIGNLFKGADRKRTKSNLMIFLRPIVMRGADEANALTMDRYQQIRAVQGEVQPASSIVLPDTGAPLIPQRPAGKAD